MTYPKRVVIDTNVLIVANEKATHVSDDCVISAVDFLEYAATDAIVVLDSSGEIVEEYAGYCSYAGQPGVGDRFFLLLHQTQGDLSRVNKVDIHPNEHDSYDEVPECLARFDRSDKKFVATVVADERRSNIVNCCDSDWSEAAEALEEARIDVVELCGIEL